jgi:RNA polymerase sigma-70 factor, ECF subfamily
VCAPNADAHGVAAAPDRMPPGCQPTFIPRRVDARDRGRAVRHAANRTQQGHVSLESAGAQRTARAERTDDQAEIRALVRRSQRGEADAFGLLYDRFQPDIVRYLSHRVGDPDVAEDLAQHVFLKAWQAIPRYQDRGVPFQAWLYRMAHNQMVDHFRTRRSTADIDGIDVPEEAEAEHLVLAAEMSETLQHAMQRLSADHRQVLVLRFLMEKSAREVGAIMGRKEVTIRGLQMRALQALRREIEAMGGMP